LAGETFQVMGDMVHLPFPTHPQGKIETRVQLATGAFTSGFAADSGHGDEGTDEERFFVEEFGETGTDLAFLGREMGAVAHRASFP